MVNKKTYNYIISIPLITSLLMLTYIPVLLNYGEGNIVNKYFSIICLFALFLLLILGKIHIKNLDFFIIFMSMIGATVSQNLTLMAPAIVIILMICFDNVDCAGLLKYYFYLYVVLIILIVICYYAFRNGNNDVVMWRMDHFVSRKALGFGHPNSFMVAYMGLVFTYLLSLKKKIWISAVVILGISYVLFQLTQSRTEFYIILIVIFGMILCRKKLDISISILGKIFLILTPIILLSISFALIFLSDNAFLNNYLSGRPALYRQFYVSYGVTLFGNSILENAMFDNGYLQMIMSKGIITLFCYYLATYRMVRSHTVTVRAFIILEALYLCSITETILFKMELFVPIYIYLSSITKTKDDLAHN